MKVVGKLYLRTYPSPYWLNIECKVLSIKEITIRQKLKY